MNGNEVFWHYILNLIFDILLPSTHIIYIDISCDLHYFNPSCYLQDFRQSNTVVNW